MSHVCHPQGAQPASLDTNRFSALESLLSKSQMYSQFLTEQMSMVEKQTEAEADRNAASGKNGAGPSKSAGRGSKAPVGAAKKGSKRGRSAVAAEEADQLAAAGPDITPTQVSSAVINIEQGHHLETALSACRLALICDACEMCTDPECSSLQHHQLNAI